MSVYSCNVALIRNYISPMLGDMKLNEITARVLEKYYATLPTIEAVQSCTQKYSQYKAKTFVALPTIRKIHNLLRSAFTQAMKWDLMERNPATLATVPKFEMKKREIWDAPTLFRAMELCEDDRLKLCMNLSFACSLRLGEMLGLTWDCVDISEESIRDDRASIFINKELQRANKAAFVALKKKDVVATFPETKVNCRTVLLLKKPKTVSSVRKVFLPKTVAEMLAVWKDEQDSVREALGAEYQDYSLVIASPLGTPVEGSRIEAAMRRLIKENNLSPVVFHSLR
ncbi:MAG: tyrosine-type recombinase/integrase, partial [Clostridia bacterium]